MKLLSTILLFLISVSLYSQEEFSDDEKKDFVELYFDAKTQKSNAEDYIRNLHFKFNIKQERVKEIVTKSIFGKPLNLSESEKLYLAALEMEKMRFEKEKNNRESFRNHVLTSSRYNMILEKYKTDIKFQRSLKPYFDNYILTKSE